MNSKLTLMIDENVLVAAKLYAKSKNITLSLLVENYLKSLTVGGDDSERQKSGSVVESLKGSFKTIDNLDYKEELANRLDDKYL
ncbi:MAG: DUF6364 family protein [Flavobacterium sp.]